MRALTIKKLVSEIEPANWLINGLLLDTGWTLLVGRAGVGKSTFAVQLCDALQKGIDFLGCKTQRTQILYIQADSGTLEWRMMLERVAGDSEGWTVVDVPSRVLNNPKDVENLYKVIESVQPGFIVFDSLYSLTSANLNTEAIQLPINLMKMLAGTKPWMLIHHPPHHESRASGHNSLIGSCSNHWVLSAGKLRVDKGRVTNTREIALGRDENGLWCVKEEQGVSGDTAYSVMDQLL